MVSTGRVRSLALAAVLAASIAPPLIVGASAQSSGLFGGGAATGGARQTLDMTLLLNQAYDSDVSDDLRAAVGPAAGDAEAFSTMLTAGGRFAWNGTRMQLGATGSSSLRYFSELDTIQSVGHTVGVGLSSGLWSRGALSVNQTVVRSPSFLYSRLFPRIADTEPGVAPPLGADYAVAESASTSYSTIAVLSQELRGRRSVSLTADFQQTDAAREADRHQALGTYGARGQFSQTVGRNVSLSAGYGARSAQVEYGGFAGTTMEHDVNVSINYTRPLSLSRRATFGANIGSSMMAVPGVGGQRNRVVGDFRAGYQFRRTWQANANVRRAVEYLPEVAQPVLASGVTVGVGGLLSRRAELSVSAAYSTGESTRDRNDFLFDTYTGNASLRYAFTRNLAMFGEYLYYFYDFRGTTAIPGVASGLERHGVRIGVTLWAPVLGR